MEVLTVISGLDHVAIEVPEIDVVRRFYEGVLGFKTVLEKELPPGGKTRRLLFIEGPGFVLEFLDCPESQVTRNFHLCFGVSSVSRAVESLKAAGVAEFEPVREAPSRVEGRKVFRTVFSGPVGEKIELMGPE